MPKQKEKGREMSPRQWQDRWCAEAGHEAAPVVIKGKATVVCLECDTYLAWQGALGRTLQGIASKHFSTN